MGARIQGAAGSVPSVSVRLAASKPRHPTPFHGCALQCVTQLWFAKKRPQDGKDLKSNTFPSRARPINSRRHDTWIPAAASEGSFGEMRLRECPGPLPLRPSRCTKGRSLGRTTFASLMSSRGLCAPDAAPKGLRSGRISAAASRPNLRPRTPVRGTNAQRKNWRVC